MTKVVEGIWNKWAGGPIPVSIHSKVMIKTKEGNTKRGKAIQYDWFLAGHRSDIVEWMLLPDTASLD